ncbi:MAG TPA: hypothetical protein VIV56_11775 [Gemmatimonadales bacterium]
MKPLSVIGRRLSVLPSAIVLLVVACGGGNGGSPRHAGGDTLTERQRDSMLSTSKIPGASGVGKAMNAADSASARVRAADTIGP